MLKETHIKTITTFFIIGLVIITGLGIINILSLNELKTQIYNSNIVGQIEQKANYIFELTIILDILYAFFCIILAIVYSKILNKPIIKLISDAKKMVANENKTEKQKNNKNTDEVVSAFNMMTEELKENLNEMTRQKNK